MALRRQIVDLVRLSFLHHADQVGGVGHIAEMQPQAWVAFMRVLIEAVDAAGVEGGRTPLDAVNPVTLAQQPFGQKGAVLAGNARNERGFRHRFNPLLVR